MTLETLKTFYFQDVVAIFSTFEPYKNMKLWMQPCLEKLFFIKVVNGCDFKYRELKFNLFFHLFCGYVRVYIVVKVCASTTVWVL